MALPYGYLWPLYQGYQGAARVPSLTLTLGGTRVPTEQQVPLPQNLVLELGNFCYKITSLPVYDHIKYEL